MTNTVRHLRSGIPGKVPEPEDMPHGRIAINYNDEVMFTKNASNEVVALASSESHRRALAAVQSVNSLAPDSDGNVTLQPALAYDISLPTLPEPNSTLFFQYVVHTLQFSSGVIHVDAAVTDLPIVIRVDGISQSSILVNGRTTHMPEGSMTTILSGSILSIDGPADWQGAQSLSISLQFLIVD